MGNGYETSARITAEVSDPAVIGTAIGSGKLGVHGFGFPEQADRRVEESLGHALLIKQLKALLHVHGAEGSAFQVGFLGLGLAVAQLFRTARVDSAFAAAACLFDLLAHAAEGAELPLAGQFGPAPVNFEKFVAVVIDFDVDSAIAIARLEIGFPQIGRLKDMTVRINDEGSRRRG